MIQASAVEISDVTFIGVRGTSMNEKSIQLGCSKNKPCTDIKMQKIDIRPAVPGEKNYAYCYNAYGTSFSTKPHVPCLT